MNQEKRKPKKREPKYDKTQGFPKRLYDLLGGEDADRGEYAKLARKIGVSTAAISNYISGLTGVSSDNLIAIANYFNVSTDYLLGLTDIPSADTDIKAIAEYTGLSDKSISVLNYIKESAAADQEENGRILAFLNRELERSDRTTKAKLSFCKKMGTLYPIKRGHVSVESIFAELEDYIQGSSTVGFFDLENGNKIEKDEIIRRVVFDKITKRLDKITEEVGTVLKTQQRNNELENKELEKIAADFFDKEISFSSYDDMDGFRAEIADKLEVPIDEVEVCFKVPEGE